MAEKISNLFTDSKTEAKVLIGYACNNNCVFCYEKSRRWLPEKTTLELKDEITAARKKGLRKLHLIGGEPTIRPDMPDLVLHAKRTGFKNIMLTTNGRMLSYIGLARELITSGVTQFIFSIHGHNAALHDGLTGAKGSFKEAMSGIKNLEKLRFPQISANSVVTKKNYMYAPLIAGLFEKHKIRRVDFIYCAVIEGNSFCDLTPRASDSYKYIMKALRIGVKYGYRWVLRNPPMGCYFSGTQNISCGDSRDEKLFLKGKIYRDYHGVSKKKIINYTKLPLCGSCLISERCPGIQKLYLKNYGAGEIKPILKI